MGGMSRALPLILVGLGTIYLAMPTPAPAAEYVLLSRGVAATERARQLYAASWLAPGRPTPPPPAWMRPDFDDTAWAALPVSPSSGRASSAPAATGSLWLTASPPSAVPPPLPDGGIILAEESPDGGSRTGPPREPVATPDAGTPTDGGVRDGGGPPPPPPACAGTLYLRRRFAVNPAELSRVSMVTLRIRYSDGFVAYLNGTEVARRRLPEAALSLPTTLAAERGTVEPESHYLSLSPGLLQPEGNLLALEIHPRAVERCPRAEMELLGSDGPRVIHGPYIERLLDGALDLTVETDTPTQMEVSYGKGDVRRSRDHRVADEPGAQPQTLHRVHLTGMRPGGVYHYQVSLHAPGAATPPIQLPVVPFHTPPPAGRPLRFVVYGDSRSGHAVHAQVVQAIVDEDPDLVLNIGDIVERGTEDSDWDRFFAVAAPLLQKIPVYIAPGNHEYARRGQGAQRLFQLWNRQFPPQKQAPSIAPTQVMASPRPVVESSGESGARGYYSFDIAGVHFIALDSNQVRASEQLRWVEADLDRAVSRRARAIIIWMHDGPYSRGFHGDNSTLIRDYVPVFERHRVTMVFSGHDHDFERGRRGRLDYIVSGGGGAELRPLKCDVPGRRKCKHPPLAFYNEHNYVSVEVLPGALRLCAKRPDGTPLEDCQLVRR